MHSVRDVTRYLDSLAPRALAEDWDNVGLLIGNEQSALQGVMTCLTLTRDVADEALSRRAQLIVTHHPVLFRAVKSLTAATPEGAMLLDLIAAGVSIYSPHTGYDSATEGINQQLAERLGLEAIRPLRPVPAPPRCIVVCFVPAGHLETVQQAAWGAGAGLIGDYSECSFYTPGTGTFHGSDATQPTIGQAGRREQVEEVRLELTCQAARVDAVIGAVRTAHPYEEPAIDVYPQHPLAGTAGSGRYGTLPEPMPLAELNERVKRRLRVEHLPFVGEPESLIQRVGVACGAAGEFLADARRAGCQAFLTGETRFHTCLEARTAGIALLLPGHYASERPALEHLAERLAAEFPDLEVWASESESDPLRWS